MRSFRSVVFVSFVACAQASGSPEGGESLFDAHYVPPDVGLPEVAPVEDAGCVPVAGLSTWSALYQDYFGPGVGQKHAACGQSNCHGPGGPGLCWECGPSATLCYQGMLNPKAINECNNIALVKPGDPANSFLMTILRQDPPVTPGLMPQKPTDLTFCAGDMARIKTWIENGAQND